MSASTLRIRLLNDQLGAFTFPPRGEMVLTRSVADLPGDDLREVLRQVRTFDDFSTDKDPHGEHVFGSFAHNGARYFWKIDYYDRDKKYGSPDPADPAVTCRVLTVMRADEY
ncbi:MULTISPECIES: DUF3768 domain-containing protein [Rhizobium]|uniref:DUF3768 domain-containing protein n=1 Tax=Rhizobium aouanii TaxID=3118145 RepID=A0ABU8CJ16_9HYPH|nr:DUF3768 domain-containing protein [Rhizobium acaciae]MCW1410753.1 DUF3768 domain-containing protein [Rhizobium acaciae]MCW1742948.1 DUF3768 domain-containing protein [Rhizobium acaciae]MCW1750144.1 DUF3768 domain-containing protein [Rhizobium acaciae]